MLGPIHFSWGSGGASPENGIITPGAGTVVPAPFFATQREKNNLFWHGVKYSAIVSNSQKSEDMIPLCL